MTEGFRIKRKLQVIEEPYVKEILTDAGIGIDDLRDWYRRKLQEHEEELSKAKRGKWRQLDLEEAIENEKQENCACGKNKSCQCD